MTKAPLLLLALFATSLLATPAMAAACSGSFALSREYYSEADINEYNLMLIQGIGVDATRAEMWGGCIRVWVRQPDGREEMQFYEPINLHRVE